MHFLTKVVIAAIAVLALASSANAVDCKKHAADWVARLKSPTLSPTIEQSWVRSEDNLDYPVFQYYQSTGLLSQARYFLYEGDGKWRYSPTFQTRKAWYKSVAYAIGNKKSIKDVFNLDSNPWVPCVEAVAQLLNAGDVHPGEAVYGSNRYNTMREGTQAMRKASSALKKVGVTDAGRGTVCHLSQSRTFARESLLCCYSREPDSRSGYKKSKCCRTTTGDAQHNGKINFSKLATPNGIYRIKNMRMHDDHHLPWYDLERYSKGEFLSYFKKSFDNRAVFGLHPGQVSLGCVTVQVPHNPASGKYKLYNNCWSEIESLLRHGSISRGDEYVGYLVVNSRFDSLDQKKFFSTEPYEKSP